MLQESAGNGLCVSLLACYASGIPKYEMINARSLLWLLARLENEYLWPVPSLKGKRCYVWVFLGRCFPNLCVGPLLG